MCRESSRVGASSATVRRYVARVQRGQRGGGRRGDGCESAEQRVGVVRPVALDQLGIVEVVAGVEPHPLGQPRAQTDLVLGRQQGDLDAVDLVRVRVQQADEGVGRGRDVGAAPVAGQARVERLAEPVQDDGTAHLGQQGVVDVQVVLRRRCGSGQVTRRHQDHLRAGALDELELLGVTGDHLLQGGVRERADDRCRPRRRSGRRARVPARHCGRSAPALPPSPGPCCVVRCPWPRRPRAHSGTGVDERRGWRPSRPRRECRERSRRAGRRRRGRLRRRSGSCTAAGARPTPGARPGRPSADCRQPREA